jgi:hypothetical protein
MTHCHRIPWTLGAVLLALACNADAPSHGDHATTKSSTEKAATTDPHAGHVMPTDPPSGKATPSDPHAGHAMPTTGSGEAPARYDLVLSTEPKSPAAKAKTRLVLDPREGDGRAQQLAIVHEKPLHLILVSRDLSFFAHEHPERQADGTYALDFAFPKPGEYVLFGDFTPEGATGQVVRMAVTVTGEAAPAKPLTVDDRTRPKRFGELTVALAPPSIHAGEETGLTFTLERAGKAVTDMRPYLGAMGHCVVVDEGAAKFLHSHPQEVQAAGPANVVQFHTAFPDPGKYKVWGQFDVGGSVLVADFVVDVGAARTAAAPDPHAGHPH